MARNNYPAWYHAFRGLVVGTMLGAGFMMFLYETRAAEVNSASGALIPTLLWLSPLVLIAIFEIGFAIRRHRSIHFFGRIR